MLKIGLEKLSILKEYSFLFETEKWKTDMGELLGIDKIITYIKNYNNGCFYIEFCKKQYVMLDIMYFYDMIPDITIFKIKSNNGVLGLNIKIRIR